VLSRTGETRFNFGVSFLLFSWEYLEFSILHVRLDRADFMYMAPPYIAYYAVLGSVNQSEYLQTAYDQCRLQRQELQDQPGGLWTHVKYGTWQDTRHWATGTVEFFFKKNNLMPRKSQRERFQETPGRQLGCCGFTKQYTIQLRLRRCHNNNQTCFLGLQKFWMQLLLIRQLFWISF
jgi:hypothetical protein